MGWVDAPIVSPAAQPTQAQSAPAWASAPIVAPGEQPSIMDRVTASPVGRLVHNVILDPLAQIENLVGSDINTSDPSKPLLQPGTSWYGPALQADAAKGEASYQGALERNRNTPGYAAARATADEAVKRKGGSGFSEQLMSPFNSPLAGLTGLIGGLDSSNAYADAQDAAQAKYGQEHPILSTIANIGGGFLLGSPATATEKATISAARAVPRDPGLEYVQNLVAKSPLAKSPAALRASEAAANGKPITAAEAIGKPGEVAVGALARREGATPDALASVISGRSDDAAGRVLADYSQASGIDPTAARGDIQGLVTAGRAKAAPLYDQAFAGGSTAPLEDQLRSSLMAATGAKGSIAKQIKAIEDANPGALISRGAAGAETRTRYMDLHQQLQQAENDRLATLDMFQKANKDATSNAPGAVWSPRIQQFLDDPIVRQGLNKGLEVQRLESLAEGKAFNPSEFGVTGVDDAGKPIIGNVPNMRLLDAGKRGLDTILEQYRNPVTGRLVLDERGKAIDSVRRSYLKELDNLNPHYKAARASAGDYLSAQSAFDRGGKMILDGNLTAADFSKHVAGLGEADRSAFNGGIANRLFNMAQNGQLTPKVFKRPIVQQKLATLLGDQNAKAFLNNLAIETRMANFARTRVPGAGSPTAEYFAAMRDQDAGSEAIPQLVEFGAKAARRGVREATIDAALSKGKNLAAVYATRGMPVMARDRAGALLSGSPSQLADALEIAVRDLPRLPKGKVRPANLAPLIYTALPRQNQ